MVLATLRLYLPSFVGEHCIKYLNFSLPNLRYNCQNYQKIGQVWWLICWPRRLLESLSYDCLHVQFIWIQYILFELILDPEHWVQIYTWTIYQNYASFFKIPVKFQFLVKYFKSAYFYSPESALVNILLLFIYTNLLVISKNNQHLPLSTLYEGLLDFVF